MAYDCIVVGGGIVGAAVARSLAAARRSVLLLDRQAPGAEASAAAGGMIAPQIEITPGDPLLELSLAARERYPALAADLEERTGRSVGYAACGIALVAFDEARAGALEAEVATQRRLGLEARWLDRAALLSRQPGIGTAALGALLAPQDGVVDNAALTAALLDDAQRLGAQIAPGEAAVELLTKGGRVTGVRTERARREAGAVVVAAGVWSGAIKGLPRPIPVEPIRGQMALAPWPGGEPKGVLFGRDAYVVPRGDHAILGSTMEHAGFEKATTAEGIHHIRTETGALLPALLTYPILKTWAGLRPMSPDGRPILGFDPEVGGLVYATGHGRNGILLGPLTGEIVRDLVVQGETPWPIGPYAITRFQTGG